MPENWQNEDDKAYLQRDRWDLFDLHLYRDIPENQRIDRDHGHVLDFSVIQNPRIREEAKAFYTMIVLSRKRSIPTMRIILYSIRALLRFLDTLGEIPTLLALPKDDVIKQYGAYLAQQTNIPLHVTFQAMNGRQSKTRYVEKSRPFREMNQLYTFLQTRADADVTETEKDVWDVSRLGIHAQIVASRPRKHIVFTGIPQLWLRVLTKRYVLLRLQYRKLSVIFDDLKSIRAFGEFLLETHPEVGSLPNLTRAIMQEYFVYLERKGYAKTTVCSRKGGLRTFFDWLRHYDIEGAPVEELIFQEDIGTKGPPAIRCIPDDVLAQLNAHIDELPPTIQRALCVIEYVGMRLNELCELPCECLKRDSTDHIFLEFYQSKTNTYSRIPISDELIRIIREQQAAAQAAYPGTAYLFPQTHDKPIAQFTFTFAINKLAYRHQITGKDGKLFRFQGHQFRHTLATRYAREGMSPHMIQMMLGQSSMKSILPYIELRETMMEGQIQAFLQSEDRSLKAWMHPEEMVQEIPLSNGWCNKPDDVCATAMLCYSCGLFHMDDMDKRFGKQYLERVEASCRRAQLAGHERQAELLGKLASRLKSCLEAHPYAGTESHPAKP